jgi:hypothetical protein
MIFEELYTDTKRLDAYVQQIQGDTKTMRSNFELGFELSLTPKLSWKLVEKERELSFKEKMGLLRETLDINNQLKFSRPENEREDVQWIEEECIARKIIVPNQQVENNNIPSFTFWVSQNIDPNDKKGSLCLLEDFNLKDEKAISFKSASTFTLLQALVYYTRPKISSTPLADVLAHVDNPSFIKYDDRPQSLKEYRSVKEYAYEFIINPETLFDKWKCFVGDETKIKTLYRVREYGGDSTSSWTKTTVFGYPIWITKE